MAPFITKQPIFSTVVLGVWLCEHWVDQHFLFDIKMKRTERIAVQGRGVEGMSRKASWRRMRLAQQAGLYSIEVWFKHSSGVCLPTCVGSPSLSTSQPWPSYFLSPGLTVFTFKVGIMVGAT